MMCHDNVGCKVDFPLINTMLSVPLGIAVVNLEKQVKCRAGEVKFRLSRPFKQRVLPSGVHRKSNNVTNTWTDHD